MQIQEGQENEVKRLMGFKDNEIVELKNKINQSKGNLVSSSRPMVNNQTEQLKEMITLKENEIVKQKQLLEKIIQENNLIKNREQGLEARLGD